MGILEYLITYMLNQLDIEVNSFGYSEFLRGFLETIFTNISDYLTNGLDLYV